MRVNIFGIPRNQHKWIIRVYLKDTMTHNSATGSDRYNALWNISTNQDNQKHSVAWKDLVQKNMNCNFIMADPSFSKNATTTLYDIINNKRPSFHMHDILEWVAKQAPLVYPDWKLTVSSQKVPQNFEQQITDYFDNMKSLMGSGHLHKSVVANEFGPWFTAILTRAFPLRTLWVRKSDLFSFVQWGQPFHLVSPSFTQQGGHGTLPSRPSVKPTH